MGRLAKSTHIHSRKAQESRLFPYQQKPVSVAKWFSFLLAKSALGIY